MVYEPRRKSARLILSDKTITLYPWNFGICDISSPWLSTELQRGVTPLHVAQAAISQTILDLEDELEVKLLSRTRRSVKLTAAGSAFFAEAQGIMLRADGPK